MANDDAATRGGNPPDAAYRRVYPWHASNWSALTRDLARLPHALLLHGQEGLGKHAFAVRLAQGLLCGQPGADVVACGRCKGCLLFAAGTHPDLSVIEPLEDSAIITVDQVRALGDFLGLRPHTATRKVVILSPADAMNQNAANALLKLLEEPPLGSVLLLVTARLTRLPATVRSRCALMAFRPPEKPAALAWLAKHGVSDAERPLDLAGGAPLLALALTESNALPEHEQVARDLEAFLAGRGEPLGCAARWKTLGAERSLRWAQDYLAKRIRQEMIEDPKTFIRKSSYLFTLLDVISEARQLVATPLDGTLLLEDVLIRADRFSKTDRLN